MHSDIQVYIQCVGKPEAGRWLDITIDQNPLSDWEFLDEINDLMIQHEVEEWEIGDWNVDGDYPCLQEISTVEELVELSEKFSEWGYVFLEIWNNSNSGIEYVNAEEHFHYESWNEIVDEWCQIHQVEPPVVWYIDEEKLIRDLKEGTYIEAQDGTIIQVLN